MADGNPLWFIKEVGGVLKLRSGLLGRSAIALGFWLVVILAAVLRLHSDWAIIGVIVIGAVGFFVWFFPVIRFAQSHPAEALLEGAEWSSFKMFQASAKGYVPPPEEQSLASTPGSESQLVITSRPKPPESEG